MVVSSHLFIFVCFILQRVMSCSLLSNENRRCQLIQMNDHQREERLKGTTGCTLTQKSGAERLRENDEKSMERIYLRRIANDYDIIHKRKPRLRNVCNDLCVTFKDSQVPASSHKQI